MTGTGSIGIRASVMPSAIVDASERDVRVEDANVVTAAKPR
jgi:hypothetical protein